MMMKMMMMTIMMIKGFTGIEREMNVGVGRNKYSASETQCCLRGSKRSRTISYFGGFQSGGISKTEGSSSGSELVLPCCLLKTSKHFRLLLIEIISTDCLMPVNYFHVLQCRYLGSQVSKISSDITL